MCVVTMMEQRRVRSNEVLASTTGRRSRGGDALIVSRAISMSPGSSDENDSQEMVNIRAQFSKVVDSSNDEEDISRDSTAATGGREYSLSLIHI